MENKFNLETIMGESEHTRKDLVYLARTAEASERYDDMTKCMRTLVKSHGSDLSVDERNLLSVAYKNVIGVRRASWRTLNAEAVDEKSPAESESLISVYKKQVEAELKDIANDILDLLKDTLINDTLIEEILSDTSEEEMDAKKSTTAEAQVFYLKMAGDYYRYLAEAVQDDQEPEKQTAEYYKRAFELSQKVLEATHPIRLGLALNYSVCYYEILGKKKEACDLAKSAFDKAISQLDKLEEADYKDSTLIMQLLRDNLTLWTSTDPPEDDARIDDDGGD